MGSLAIRKLGNAIPFATMGTQLGGSAGDNLTYKPPSIHAEPMDVRNALAETVPGNTTDLNIVRATQTRRAAIESLNQRNNQAGAGKSHTASVHMSHTTDLGPPNGGTPSLMDMEGIVFKKGKHKSRRRHHKSRSTKHQSTRGGDVHKKKVTKRKKKVEKTPKPFSISGSRL
jgi:hypothetical protein